MEFNLPKHPDDFGYTEEGYIEWLKKNNPHIAPWDFISKATGKLKEKYRWQGTGQQSISDLKN